jgi:hypothetical protein
VCLRSVLDVVVKRRSNRLNGKCALAAESHRISDLWTPLNAQNEFMNILCGEQNEVSVVFLLEPVILTVPVARRISCFLFKGHMV